MKLSRLQRIVVGLLITLFGIAYGISNNVFPKEYFSLNSFLVAQNSLLYKIRDAWLLIGFFIFLLARRHWDGLAVKDYFIGPVIILAGGFIGKLIPALIWGHLRGHQLWKFMTDGWFIAPPTDVPGYVLVGVLIWFTSIILALTLLPLGSILFLIFPTQQALSNHRRGRELLSFTDACLAAERERAKENSPRLYWGWCELPWSFATKHFLACGSTGSGKTTLIRLLMQSVLHRIGEQPDERALIYDAKQDIYSILDGMNITARPVLLNPFDSRSAAWDIAKDVTEPSTAQQIASILIPDEKNASQPFFADAARHLMAGVMRRFIKTAPGNWTLADVVFAMLDEDRLRKVLGDDPELSYLLTYLKDQKTGASILATILTKIQPYEFIAAVWSRCHQKVILRDWVKGDYILILGNDEAQRSALDSINQAIFKRIVELVLAEENSESRRTWFFLDEVREAGKLDGLQSLLTKGRSKGAAVVLGFQDIDGLKEVYGEYLVSEITGQCACKALLRTDSAKTAEWGSILFGDRELMEVNSSESRSEGTSGDFRNTSTSEGSSRSSTTQLVKRATVLPGELMSLPLPGGQGAGPLAGYFIVPNIGPYGVSYNWHSVQSMLSPPSSIPNLVRRHSDHERLRPWEEKDLTRLGLNAESIRKQIGISEIGSNSKQSANVKAKDKSLLAAARQIRERN